MIPMTGIQEVFLDVQSIERMLCFYHDVLGLEITYPRNVRDYACEQTVTLNAYGVLLTLRARSGGQRIPAPQAGLVFGVRDLNAARVYLQGRGVPVSEIRCNSDADLCEITDPEGNRLTLAFRQPATAVPAGV